MRVALTTILLTLSAGPAVAWAPETRTQMLDEALRFMPASLRSALVRHRDPLRRGMLKPLMNEDLPEHRPPWGGGSLDGTLEREALGLVATLDRGSGFAQIAERFGRLAHYVVDAGFPPGVSRTNGDTRYRHFSEFCESRRGRFPLVFYGHEDPALGRDDYRRFALEIMQSASLDDERLGRAYAAAGDPPAPDHFGDRSVPFALGSLHYSRSINHIVRAWLAVWQQAQGDMGRTPYWIPPQADGDREMKERVRRALVSVYDKTGIVEFCSTLAELDIEIISSGGTARVLGENGIAVSRVADYTGFPEMLDGRVKTLHPRIHAGILAVRENEEHLRQLREHKIDLIDLVVVNLYPFEQTVAIEGIGMAEAIEMIDIGGPTMVRGAAKNAAHVGVVVRPPDYAVVTDELRGDGALADATRHRLAFEAFRHTANYDNAVQAYLGRIDAGGEHRAVGSALPERLQFDLTKQQDLRYGENPHQAAAFYREPLVHGPSLVDAAQLQGKPLSFNNILDFDAALGLATEFGEGACVIVKHGNPCGTALGSEPRVAFERALACDPLSAFGGVIAFNRQVDRRAAEAVKEQFYEGVVAPAFDSEAREVLAGKKNLRLLELGDLTRATRGGFDLRRVGGGLLAQQWDALEDEVRRGEVVSGRSPTEDEWKALAFSWVVAKHVKSNAIVFGAANRTLGVGAGQMSRVDSVRIATQKAQSSLAGAAMASDAFFPFRDCVDLAHEAGITAVAQPGGSIRDKESVAAADEHGMAMVLTGRRHFRH